MIWYWKGTTVILTWVWGFLASLRIGSNTQNILNSVVQIVFTISCYNQVEGSRGCLTAYTAKQAFLFSLLEKNIVLEVSGLTQCHETWHEWQTNMRKLLRIMGFINPIRICSAGAAYPTQEQLESTYPCVPIENHGFFGRLWIDLAPTSLGFFKKRPPYDEKNV